ncbi:integrase catalytic domain-containing protein, partial [Trichonephila clavata]
MSIVSKLKKDELKLVAEKIGLTVPGDAKMIDLKRLIEESDVFKEDYEFVKSVIEQVLEEVKPQKSQLNEVPAVNFPRYVDEIHNCEPYQRELKDNQMESMCFLVQNNEILPIIDKCSSFLKLQGVIAWCVRFKEKNSLQITTGNLTVAELSTALLCLVRKVQSVYFTTEIWCIERGQQLPDSINLLTLSPFLDERKILCVGGRLRHSNLPAEQKDPMLIPNNHLICDLIVKHYHFSYLHTGAEATLANIRTKFWIVNGRSKVKRIKCLKVSAKGKNQMMAVLPSARSHSFRNCNLSIEAVLVKGEDNSKLLNWNLAKIVEVHPGTDDITRVVTLKT